MTVNDYTRLTKNTKLGTNCNFNGLKIPGNGLVIIGNNFYSENQILFFTSNYDYGDKLPYDETYITKNIIIEDNVWIGSRIIILGGVTLGEGCVIQEGSVMVNSIPKYAIAGGHPAKVFKYRNKEHYQLLKENVPLKQKEKK